MTNPVALRHCPFCDIHVVETGSGYAVHHRAGCFLGKDGPTFFAHEDRQRWNERRTPEPLPVLTNNPMHDQDCIERVRSLLNEYDNLKGVTAARTVAGMRRVLQPAPPPAQEGLKINYDALRTNKPASEITPADIPRGFEIDDVAQLPASPPPAQDFSWYGGEVNAEAVKELARRAVPDETLAHSKPDLPTAQHPDDAAVDRFAAAMKKKLAKKRAEGKHGWDDPDVCSMSFLLSSLRHHVEKGDPVDVANFAMMIWHRDAKWVEASLGQLPASEARSEEG